MTRRLFLAAAIAAAFAGSIVNSPAHGQAGKPDMTGVWIGLRGPESPYRNSRPPTPPPYTPEGEKMGRFWESPQNNLGQKCLPPAGPAGVTNASTYFPMEVIQKDKQVTFINEYQSQVRRVYMDGRGHPDDLDPSWYGHSVGKWDGDTLVVDTVGVKYGALGGGIATVNVRETDNDPRLPFSDKLHLVERFRLLDGGKYLESEQLITDPVMYTKPFTMKKYWRRAEELVMYEYICAENLRPELEGSPPSAE